MIRAQESVSLGLSKQRINFSADFLPTFRNLTDSYESWAYRNGLLRQVVTLERQQFLERDATAPD